MAYRLSVAPMMDWTDRHCRVFHRRLTRRTLLYTEMVTARALMHGDPDHLLRHAPEERPLALQLGGSVPEELAAAVGIARGRGFCEINLNVGCPSDRVQDGAFGACLMREPGLVADCIASMKAAVAVPVTVKCRLGVDDQETGPALDELADAVVAAGADGIWVHARKAWLKGLSPKENREVPPLDYGVVYALKRARPDLKIIINGGIGSLDEAEAHLAHVDGVMLGRTAYQTPAILLGVDSRFFGERRRELSDAIEAYVDYVARRLADGAPLNAMTKHMLGLFHGRPGARLFRRHLSENAPRRGADLSVLRDALAHIGHERAEAA